MPHYNRHAPKILAPESAELGSGGDRELADAAAALRETEIEAAGEQAVVLRRARASIPRARLTILMR